MLSAQINFGNVDDTPGGSTQGTPVDPVSGLATDFLNQFNEVIMILEMLPMAPELFDEIADWTPVDYAAHFRRSGFSDWQDVVDAYEAASPFYREPFDEAVDELSALLADAIARIRLLSAQDDTAAIEGLALASHAAALPLISVLTGLIQGREVVDAVPAADEAGGATQSEIDALFD